MQTKKNRARRWWLFLLTLAVVLAVGWQAGKRFLDIERYRALAAQELEKRTGLPVVLGEAEARLWPTPRVVVHDVRVGDGTFGVQLGRVDAEAELGLLFQGKLGVSRVILRDLVVDFPEAADEIAARIAELRSHLGGEGAEAAPGATSSLAVTVSRVEIEDAIVRRGGDPFLEGNVTGHDVLSGKPRFEVSLRYPRATSTTAEGEVTIDLADDAPGIDGLLDIVSGNVWELAGVSGSPHLTATAKCAISGTLPNEVGLDLQGELDSKDAPSLDGTFVAKAWWTDGQIVVNDIVIDAPALKGSADVTRTPAGEVVFDIRDTRVTAQGLTLATAFTPLGRHVKLGGPKASLDITSLLGSVPPDGPIRLARGEVRFEGVDIDRGDVALAGVAGTVHIEENVITIEKATAPGLSVSGKLSPNLETQAVAFDLQASATLSDALAGTFVPVEGVSGLGGKLDFKRIAGTWKPGLALPEGLVVQGNIADGHATLAFSAFQDEVSAARASFTSDGKVVNSDFSAATNQFGTVKGTAKYTLSANVVDGEVTLDLERAAAPYLPEGSYADLAKAVAASYGTSTFAYRVNLPAEGKPKLEVLAKRQATPALDATLRMAMGDAVLVESIDARSDVALDLVTGALPEGARAQGSARVTVTADPGLSAFNAEADLTQAVVAWGEHVEKRAGDALLVRTRGVKQGSSFSVKTIRVEFLGEAVDLALTENGLAAENMAVQLAPLARLFPEIASASGLVRGTATLGEPLSASVRFEGASVSLSQGVAIEGLTGEVSGGDDVWAFKNLAMKGLNSDATLTGELRGKVFKADIRGQRLDGNALLALGAFAPSPSAPQSSTPSPSPQRTPRKQPPAQVSASAATPASPDSYTGEATVNLGALAYKRGELNDVRAKVRLVPGAILVEDLVCRPKTGSAKGTVRVETAGSGGITTKIQFENADLSIIDAMLLDTPRGLEGTATGTVDLRLNSETGKGPLSGLNGDVVYVAQSGSYGNFGIATSLLSVLRTTQILQLSRPKLGQRGLVFAESNAQLHITDGVLNIQQFDLSEPAYALSADGYIDFPNDDMNAVIRANLFDTVTGIVAAVPGLRNTTESLRNRSALKLTLTGSPRNPTVREEHGPQVLQETVEGAGEAVQSTEDLVRDGIGEIFRRIQR